MDAPQYPGYHSQYWYPQSHSTGHYTSNYPPGSDVQPQYSPQVIPGAYPSAVYSPAHAHYPANAFHPSNPFYGADPQPPSSGPFPNQGCPAEQSSGLPGPPPSQHQHHHYPAPHCQGGSGYSSGAYPQYSESTPNPPYPTSQPLPPSSQADTWTHPGGYGPAQQPWQPGQNQYVRPAQPPAWPGTGSGAPPPYQPKDQKQQGAPPVGGKARPGPSSKPSMSAEISSPPQMYPRSRGPESQSPAAPSLPSPAPGPGPGPGQAPSLARVQEVMSRVLLLQEDVEEFVGKKTDKSYRCLEELLTKELLVLDSVETGGHETVRQARKEAVQHIQAILDALEKKAF